MSRARAETETHDHKLVHSLPTASTPSILRHTHTHTDTYTHTRTSNNLLANPIAATTFLCTAKANPTNPTGVGRFLLALVLAQ